MKENGYIYAGKGLREPPKRRFTPVRCGYMQPRIPI
jgi:hypothetical protein